MNPEEILLNANIFSITDLTLPLTMLPARDRITGQIKRTALPRSASPCKRKEANRICGHGGIGRLGGFRFHCESVQVRVLLPAPTKKNLCLPRQRFFFELSVPPTRNVKYPSVVKRTSCVKCAFGTIYGTLNFTLRQWRNTSLFRKA